MLVSTTIPSRDQIAASRQNPRAAAIQVEHLVKHYPDVKAVDDLSFSVAAGEVFGLLGPNGAGKTTTTEIVEGLRQPDSGTVRVLELDVQRHTDTIKQRIGVQLPMLFLSGIFFPVEAMPGFLHPVADALPLTYLADALRQVMISATPYHSMLVNSLVLLGWLVVSSALAIRFFRGNSRGISAPLARTFVGSPAGIPWHAL